MRVAVISDLHANARSLQAALSLISTTGVDELWCLGDLVGYGNEPHEVVETVRAAAALCLAGNHDLAVNDPRQRQALPPVARTELHAAMLAEEQRAWLGTLAPYGRRAPVACYHGNAEDPVWGSIETAQQAAFTLEAAGSAIILVGHTHRPRVWSRPALAPNARTQPRPVRGEDPHPGELIWLDPGREWLLNPGSLGCPNTSPRDRRYSWLLLDLDARTAIFHRLASGA